MSGLVHLVWQQKGRMKYKGRDGCVHVHILMKTTDVCASFGCTIGMHF